MKDDVHERLERLESLVEDQQERIENQEATIERQREAIRDRLERPATADAGAESNPAPADDSGVAIGRRTALKAGGLLALLGVGAVGTANAADPSGQVGTAERPLSTLYAREIRGAPGGDEPFDVQVGGDHALRIEPSSASDHGPNIVGGGPENAAEGDAAAATIGGGGTVDSPNVVRGPYGTVAGGVGNVSDGDGVIGANTIGGGIDNEASAFNGATIAGGRENVVGANYATVSGGYGNEALEWYATVAGGRLNEATGDRATIAGGQQNEASTPHSTIGGGIGNVSGAIAATVTGGGENEATGEYATVLGGRENTASGDYSIVGGRNARATEDGQVMITDSNENVPASSTEDRFYASFDGGYRLQTSADDGFAGVYLQHGDGSWSTLSDPAVKTNVSPIDTKTALEKVQDLSIRRWSYEWQTDVEHVGPMAGELHDAFGVGRDDGRIQTIDADGVLFAAVQGLAKRLDERGDRIEDIEAARDELAVENAELRERVAAIEDRLDGDEAATTSGGASR